jgi:sugar lactone lactonase YvrE
MTFAYASPGIPDGIHCDTNGNVYSGVGDGVHVWNTAGKLLGKIYLGRFAANFRFAGEGRMIVSHQPSPRSALLRDLLVANAFTDRSTDGAVLCDPSSCRSRPRGPVLSNMAILHKCLKSTVSLLRIRK